MKAISVKVNLKGFDILEPKIKSAIGRGLDKVGLQIERDARIFAPRDTGRLKASISKIRKGLSLRVIANTFYAEYMERPGNVIREGRRPYMRPALLKNLSRIKNILTQEIRRVLR